jgi:hypothetical protein
MLVSGSFNVLFRPGLRRDFRDSYQAYAPQYGKFLRVGTTDTPEQAAVIVAGFNRLYDLGDGEPVTYEDPKIGPKVMAVDKEFGVGFIISRRAVEDDLYGKANQAAKWLAYAARMTYEYKAAAFLDDAFTGSLFKGYDNLSWMNTAHTLVGSGSTFSNMVANPVGLSMTGIVALQDLALSAVNQTGDPIVVNPDTIIVGNDAGNYNRALQIIYSALEPFTAENQENPYRLRQRDAGNGNNAAPTKVVMNPYMTNKKSYFFVDSNLNDVSLLVKRPVDFEDTHDFDSGAAKYKTTTRFLIWGVDPIGWFGANPT